MSNRVVFASAYRQLNAVERDFVDGVVEILEQTARRVGERIVTSLNKPLPDTIVDRSNGLLDRPLVTAAITERISEIASDEDLTIARWVREVKTIAFSNVDDYFEIDEYGQTTLSLERCPREALAAVKTLDIESVGDPLSANKRTKIKFATHDKIAALKMLGEYTGAMQSDNPHWRADMARTSLPAGATAQQAGDIYAALIGD